LPAGVFLNWEFLLAHCPSSKPHPLRTGTLQSRGDMTVRAAKLTELVMEEMLNDHSAM